MESNVEMNTEAQKLNSIGKMVSQFSRQTTDLAESLMRGAYLLALLLTDLLAQGLAYRLAFWIRFELQVTLAPEVVPSIDFYFQLTAAVAVGSILLFALAGLYDWDNLLGGTQEYARAFNVCTVAFIFVVIATFLFPNLVISRGWLATSWILSVIFVLGGRFLLRRVIYALRARGFFLVKAAILGRSFAALQLEKELRSPKTGYKVLGTVSLPDELDSAFPQERQSGPSVLGRLDDLEEVVARLGVRELVVPASSMHREQLFELYARIHGIEGLELRLSTELFELLTTGVQVRTAGVVPLIGLRKARLDGMELIVKTAVEYLLAILGLILIWPLLVLIGVMIRIDSPGPVIYRRRVVGAAGREFDAYKFRTMHVNGDRLLEKNPDLAEEFRVNEKLKSDPRVTRLGFWLRKYSLDELPQLFNVLFGQMSLVGPRMISPPEAEKYGFSRFNLLSVKPGMTGLWQVSGRSDLSYQERIRLDMYYIRNYTIWMDLHILFVKTAMAVLQGRGAY